MDSIIDALLDKSEGVFTDSEDEDYRYVSEDEDTEDERANLLDLAQQIMALHCPEKNHMFAERMLACGQDEYSRSFYEMATKIEKLKDDGYSLKEVVRYLSGKIPPLEALQAHLTWGDTIIISKAELQSAADMVKKLGFDGRDMKLSKRILGNKAAVDDWKLAALRVADIYQRIADRDPDYTGMFKDQARTEKEFAVLKKHVKHVAVVDHGYKLNFPIFPPWNDIAPWDGFGQTRGYWIDYTIKLQDPLPPPQDEDDNLPLVLATVDMDGWKSDTNTANMTADSLPTQIPQTQIVATVSSMKRMAHTIGKIGVYKSDGTLVQIDSISQIQQVMNLEVIEDNEIEVVTEDPNVLSDDDQSVAEENARIMDEIGIFSTAELLSPGTLKICDATEHREDHVEGTAFPTDAHTTSTVFALGAPIRFQKLAANYRSDLNRKKVPTPIQIGTILETRHNPEEALHSTSKQTDNTDLQFTDEAFHGYRPEKEFISTAEQITTGTHQISANTVQRKEPAVDPPSTFDKEFPQLPSQNTAAQEQNKSAQNRGNNVWVDRSKKKSYMNDGLGGKLVRNDTSSPSFHIDVNSAFSIKDIWGYSLLGQYVGHHPGHFLINSMIKGWGVKAKYKMEEGWFIFTFNTQEDQVKVLLGGPYLIRGRPMILKYIPDKFAFNKRDVAKVPLWVRIYGLASRFWTVENLGGIASYIGNPLYMDPVTESRKRNAYARVLVEVNLAADITRKVPINFSDGDAIEVNFLVENEPKFCPECCSFGHDNKECNFNKTKATVGVKDKLANTQPQLNLTSTERPKPDTETHKSLQENLYSSTQATPVHNHEDYCHSRAKKCSTDEQHITQHKYVQGTSYEQNQRTTSNQQQVWIEKKKEHQKYTTEAGRQDGIPEHTSHQMHDGSSNYTQGTAKNIPLKNRFDPLQATGCTNEERGGKSVMKATYSTQEISPTHQARSPKQPATDTSSLSF